MHDWKEFLLSVISSLVAAAIWATAKPISRWLIGLAVLRMSSRERDRFREEWPAHLNEIDGPFGKLRHAFACVFMAAKIDRELRSRQETQSSRAHSMARGWSQKVLSGLASAAILLWLNPSLRTFPPNDPVVTQFPTNGTPPLEYLPPTTSLWPSPRVAEFAFPAGPPTPSNDDAPVQGPTLALSAPYPRPSDLIRLPDTAINPGIALSTGALPNAIDVLNGITLNMSVALPQTFYSSKAIALGEGLNQPYVNANRAFAQAPYSSATTIVADVLNRFTLSANAALAEPLYASMTNSAADLLNRSNPNGMSVQPSYGSITASTIDVLNRSITDPNGISIQPSYGSITAYTTDVPNRSITNPYGISVQPSYGAITAYTTDVLNRSITDPNGISIQPSYGSITAYTSDVLNRSITNPYSISIQPSYASLTTSTTDVVNRPITNPNSIYLQPSYAPITAYTTDVLNGSIVNLAQPSYASTTTPITDLLNRSIANFAQPSCTSMTNFTVECGNLSTACRPAYC
jgi:hypothetical protein